MRNPSGMYLSPIGNVKTEDFIFLAVIAAVAAATSLAVFLACFFWFKREQRRLHARILASVDQPDGQGIFGLDHPRTGELVAQFRAKQGKQVISVLEADGKRFVHVDGEITAPERAKMVRYLKSEGFMS
jgi:hypothetical protein